METLLEQGLRVTGLDGEPAMLQRARQRLDRFGAQARFVQGDMCGAYLKGERFDLVVVAVNTFMHLDDHAAQRACLHGIYAHLKESGTAVLDLANPFHTLALPQGVVTLRRQAHDAVTGREVTVMGSLEVDPTAPRVVDHLIFDEAAADGTLRRLAARVELRLVFMPELELLLAAAGLGIADAYGDYELGPYHGAAERMIAVVRRYPDVDS
jgi:SAM-dependent methyltransferase